METKKDIRKRCLAARKLLGERERAERSLRIWGHVRSTVFFRAAQEILCYADFRSEVRTLPFLEECLSMGKKVYCPLVEGKAMEFYRILSVSELRSGYMGIPEPIPLPRNQYLYDPEKAAACLMLIPGAAFDRRKHRIGYGKGYYDRYLAGKEKLTTIALAYDCQIEDEIPAEEYDIRPAFVASETGIF